MDIEQIVNSTMKQAESIASDTRFSEAHKIEEIAAKVAAGRATLESTAGAAIASREKERDELTQQMQIPFAPPIEQAAALNYVHAAIQARFTGRTGGELAQEMFSQWDMALTAGDMLTARVFRDFLPSMWRAAGEKLTPVAYQEYVDRTNEGLLTPDQRAAREKLDLVNKTLGPLQTAAMEARIKLDQIALRGDKIVMDSSKILRRVNY